MCGDFLLLNSFSDNFAAKHVPEPQQPDPEPRGAAGRQSRGGTEAL